MYYSVSGYAHSGKIHLSIPVIQVENNENVKFHVIVSKDEYEGNYFECVYGDNALYN